MALQSILREKPNVKDIENLLNKSQATVTWYGNRALCVLDGNDKHLISLNTVISKAFEAIWEDRKNRSFFYNSRKKADDIENRLKQVYFETSKKIRKSNIITIFLSFIADFFSLFKPYSKTAQLLNHGFFNLYIDYLNNALKRKNLTELAYAVKNPDKISNLFNQSIFQL